MSQEEKSYIAAMFAPPSAAELQTVRVFDTGSTRSPLGDKFAYSGFISPLVLKRFAAYMHLHRTQSDGTIRAANNWQRGIPQASYLDSIVRHMIDVWLHSDGYGDEATEDEETALCAIMFNAQGKLFEILKEKRNAIP